MSPRLIIAGQAGAVIGLVALVLFQARQLREVHRQLEAASNIPLELPLGTNQRPLRLRLQSLPPINIKTEVQELDWRHVESADYATYVANLRRIGCPEETIRDIILADIDKLYAARRRAFQPAGEDWEFWRHPSERPANAGAAEAERGREFALAHLERERRQLIVNLLGESAIRAQLADFSAEAMEDRNLQFLTREKRQAIADALAHWRLALDDAQTAGDDDESGRLRTTAQNALEEALANALTPSEREQYDLRSSPRAEELRERLLGFGASREEFEQLYRLDRDLENEQGKLTEADGTAGDADVEDQVDALKLENEKKTRDLLGPQRYSDLLRSNDADYHTLYALALDHSMSTDVANQVWGMRREVETQTDRIRANPLLTAEQKVLALRAVRAETQSAIVDVLGEPLLRAYQREGGGWLQDLTETTDVGGSDLTITPPPLPVVPQQAGALPLR